MPSINTAIKVVSITSALAGAGGIATLSAFDIPELKSQPASRSLPQVRWLFSRGSHIFPQSAEIATAGFAALAIRTLFAKGEPLVNILKLSHNGPVINGYLAAALLCISIGPWTRFAMVPTNFELMKINEKAGGARSQKSAEQRDAPSAGERSAADSVAGKGEASEFTDLSGPQTKTKKDVSAEDEKRVQELLTKFNYLNYPRAALLLAGGVVGLITALP